MTNIYHLTASGRYDGSTSRLASKKLVEKLKSEQNAKVTERDISQGLHFVNETFISGLYLDNDERSPKQKESLKLSDEIVKEIQDADIIVLGTPVYNFGAPASLKAWADLVARAGVTFKYSENGPIGLLKGKKLYAVVVSGGTKIGSDIDFLTPWLKHFLGFIGIDDVEFLTAEDVNNR